MPKKKAIKIPVIRQLPSGAWTCQLRLNGESINITDEDYNIVYGQAVAIKSGVAKARKKPEEITLTKAIDKYIEARSNILSPSTVRGYSIIKNNRFKSVMSKPISNISDWQSICNTEAKLCAPKTLKNSWAFIVSVLRDANMPIPKVNLPQAITKDRPYLDPDEIKEFISAIKDTACEIPALLALHSLRVSEICALSWEKNVDLKNKRILVSGALVPDKDNKFVLKETNKNASSRRYVPIMIDVLYNKLSGCITKTGPVVGSSPSAINKQINRICAAKKLPLVGVHGLRHSFASLAYHLGMPEKIAMQIGGWADQGTMHKIYTHLAQKDIVKFEQKMSVFYNNANDIANDK